MARSKKKQVEEVEDEPEYDVKEILNYIRFEDAWISHMNYRRGIYKTMNAPWKIFAPETFDKTVHCPYLFRVSWEGYEVDSNSWEPERNMINTLAYHRYQERHGLPRLPKLRKRFRWDDEALTHPSLYLDQKYYDLLMERQHLMARKIAQLRARTNAQKRSQSISFMERRPPRTGCTVEDTPAGDYVIRNPSTEVLFPHKEA
ncbi:unnamed protein product, partial [Mesorhabditis spiculigera]